MDGLEEVDPIFEGMDLNPFDIWDVTTIKFITEDGVATNTVLMLASSETDRRFGIRLHPHTAAEIGIELTRAFIEQ